MTTPPAFADPAEVLARARALAAGPGRVLLGIAGSPGAGKSTLAEALTTQLTGELGPGRVAYVPMDGFHLADRELERLGRRDRKGAPDTFDAGGYAALLRRLRVDDPSDDPVYAPGFERDLEQPLAGAIPVPATARLVITEGNYLLLPGGRWPEVRAALDEVWFCDPDPAVRRERLIARHVRFGKPPDAARAWVARVDDPNAALVAATRDRADRIVPGHVLDRVTARWSGWEHPPARPAEPSVESAAVVNPRRPNAGHADAAARDDHRFDG